MKKIAFTLIVLVCVLTTACGNVQVGTVLEEQEAHSNMTGVVSNVIKFSVQPTFENYAYDRRSATAEVTFADEELVTISFPNEAWAGAIEVSKNTKIAKKDDEIILTFEGYDKYNVKLPEDTIETESGKPIDVLEIVLYSTENTRS